MSTIDLSKLQIVTEEQLVNKPIEENGLLSQRIFGPVKIGTCACGLTFLKSTADKECDKCHVENVSINERSTRYAKIVTPLPFATLLEQTELVKDLDAKNWMKQSYKGEYYLHHNVLDNFKLNSNNLGAVFPTPITGIYQLWMVGKMIEFLWDNNDLLKYFGNELLVVPPNSRPSILSNVGNKVSFISDLDAAYNNVISRSKYISAKLNNIDQSRYILLHLSSWFNFDIDTLDLNDYASVMDISKHMLFDEDVPVISHDQLVQHSELLGNSSEVLRKITLASLMMAKQYFDQNSLYICDTNIATPDSVINDIDEYIDTEIKVANNSQKAIQNEIDSAFTCITSLLSGKEGLIRSQFIGRTIDFSARAVITCNPYIKPYEVKIPLKIFVKLFFIEYLAFLFNTKPETDQDEDLSPGNLDRLIRNSDLEKKDHLVSKFVNYFFEKDDDVLDRLVLINRQPTLWRYGIPAIKVVGISDSDSIQLNPLMLDPLNGDFDGDTAALYRCHDYKARVEMHENAYIMNTVRFDHNTDFLHTLKDESYYMYNLYQSPEMSDNGLDDTTQSIRKMKLNDIKLNYVNVCSMHEFVQLTDCDNEIVSIGTCMINISAGFESIKLKKGMSRQLISKTIFDHCLSNKEYFDRLHYLSLFLNYYHVPNDAATVPFQECIDVTIMSKESKLLGKLPIHPTIGYAVHQSEANKIIKQITPDMSLYKYRQTKFGKTQFIRSFIHIGYIADQNNISQGNAINAAAFGGLTTKQFFRTSYGTRKGITDKQEVTPKAGYLARSMNMNLSPVEIGELDCGVTIGFEIHVRDKAHAHSLVRRYYKVKQDDAEWLFIASGHDAEHLIGEDIVLRSPILCRTPNMRICQCCFGKYDRIPSKYVGVLSGGYLSERITQLSMRSFHTSGSSNYSFSKMLYDFFEENLVDITRSATRFKLIFKIPVPSEIVAELVSSFTDDKDVFMYAKSTANGKELEFTNVQTFENHDVTKVLKTMNGNLRTKKNTDYSMLERTYNQQISNILTLGGTYSTFVEISMCNSYIHDDKILRYCIADDGDIPAKLDRLNIKDLHKLGGSILSLLYVPNKTTILDLAKNGLRTTNGVNSVFENIWLGKL